MAVKRGPLNLNHLLVFAALLLVAMPVLADQAVVPVADRPLIDERVWSISYWQSLAARGLVPVAPDVPVEPATYLGPNNELDQFEDTPDVCTTGNQAVTQSENSVFVDPNNFEFALESNNSTNYPYSQFWGISSLYSADQGLSWSGQVQGWGGGDPAVAIDNDGNWYLATIGNGSQDVVISTNGGQTYSTHAAASGGGVLYDKGHLWVDNTGGLYDGRVYVAWTSFYGVNDGEIEVVWSNDVGQTWHNRQPISQGVNAGYLNQGVNLDVGPDGTVYACWTIYDAGLDEHGIGFTKSTDGGVTWEQAHRAINNIYGIRSYGGMQQNHRKNSFPVMTCDVSGGAYDGNLYIVWTNVGVPGINTGPDVASWLIRSSDGGDTWSAPIRVQQDIPQDGNQHYFGWIQCDPVTGTLNMIWYDNRNTAGGAVEAWIGICNDDGQTWEDFRVSDVSFTPAPIQGLATGYFGDYLGIYGREGVVYPMWTDNRSNHALTYTSVYYTDVPLATVHLDPFYDPPVIVPGSGGDIQYDGRVTYYYNVPQNGQAWTEALMPNGNTMVLDVYNIAFQPGMTYQALNQILHVPGGAPNGIYQFIAKVGLYPNFVVDMDQFEFRKIQFGADSEPWRNDQLSSTKWFAETTADDAPAVAELPSQFGISAVTPNPFNPSTSVRISVPNDGRLTVRVFNTLGREVVVLADGDVTAGTHSFSWDGSDLASGVYFVKAEMAGQSALRKVTLMK